MRRLLLFYLLLILLLCFVLPGALRVKEDYTFTEEQGQKLSSHAEITSRIKTIKELAEVARSHHLEDVCNIVIDCRILTF